MLRLIAIPVALAAVLTMTACSGGVSGAASSAEATRVKGSITLTSGAYIGSSPCYADDGYDDVATGAEVDIVDSSGKVIAIGNLEDGISAADGCEFDFTVTDVPNDQKIYGVKVGNSNRGTVHFSKAQLFGGQAKLTLG